MTKVILSTIGALSILSLTAGEAIFPVVAQAQNVNCSKTSRTPVDGKYPYLCVQYDGKGEIVKTWMEWRSASNNAGIALSVPQGDRGTNKDPDRRADNNCPIVARTPDGVRRMCPDEIEIAEKPADSPDCPPETVALPDPDTGRVKCYDSEEKQSSGFVQDPIAPPGSSDPIYPGLPPAPKVAGKFEPEPNDPPEQPTPAGTGTRLQAQIVPPPGSPRPKLPTGDGGGRASLLNLLTA